MIQIFSPNGFKNVFIYLGSRSGVYTRAGIFIRFESIHVHFRLNRFASTESIHKYKISAFSY